MSITGGKRGIIPNWIDENDWTATDRIDWIHRIMAFSSRDWSRTPETHHSHKDPEMWAIWILACIDTKEEALETWYSSCDDWNTPEEE